MLQKHFNWTSWGRKAFVATTIPVALHPLQLVDESKQAETDKSNSDSEINRSPPTLKTVRGLLSYLFERRLILWGLILAGILVQETLGFVFSPDRPLTSKGEEERILTTNSWKVVRVNGLSSPLFEDTWNVGSVWTFYWDNTMKAGKPVENEPRYNQALLSGPTGYIWNTGNADQSLRLHNRDNDFRFRVQELGPSKVTLELATNRNSYVELANVPRISSSRSYCEKRLLFYGLWLPIVFAPYIAFLLSSKSSYSKPRKFVQCLLLTVGLGAAFGAILGFLQDAVYGEGVFRPSYWLVLCLIQAVICFIVGIVTANICALKAR